MEPSEADTLSAEYRQLSAAWWSAGLEHLPLGIAAVLFLTAGVAQFVFGPATSPGFTYLAVVCALGGVGALLAGGLRTQD